MSDEINAIIPAERKVTLAGKEYPVRQLSVAAVFRLASVMNKVFDVVPAEQVLTMENKAAGLLVIARGIPAAEDDICAILADILDIKDVAEVKRLPASGMIKVIRMVVEQEDLEDLFFELNSLVEKAQPETETEEAPSPE